MKHFRSTSIALVAAMILTASCSTSSKPPPIPAPAPLPIPEAPPAPPPEPVAPPRVPDEEIIKAGATLFSDNKIGEAEETWSTLADPEKKSLYLSFSQAYSTFDESVTDAEKALSESGPEAAITAAKESGSPPPPPESLDSGKADPREAGPRLARVASEAAAALVARAYASERKADASLELARSGKDRDPASSAGKAIEGYAEAARLYIGASDWLPDALESARRVEAKTAAAEELRKRLAKETLLSFSERMGEVFARTPSSQGKLNDKEILAFNAETAAMISGGLSDFERIIAEYPDILDPASIVRLRESTRGLSGRFARIESTIKAVKDRGKPLMPLIIGIFNPQPGDPQRSRPSSFGGTLAGESDWWWGIADIPKGLAQDLVISMSDARPVRVYAAGLGSGSKRPTSDLVNPIFKVGNSWPVLNAGARLEKGVFHIEVGPSRSERYQGEAVVYKSFMTRTR